MPKENSTHQVDPMDKWVSIEQAANYLGGQCGYGSFLAA